MIKTSNRFLWTDTAFQWCNKAEAAEFFLNQYLCSFCAKLIKSENLNFQSPRERLLNSTTHLIVGFSVGVSNTNQNLMPDQILAF